MQCKKTQKWTNETLLTSGKKALCLTINMVGPFHVHNYAIEDVTYSNNDATLDTFYRIS